MPREWPPVSVWMASLAVAGYPSGLTTYLYWTGDSRWKLLTGLAGSLVAIGCGLVFRIRTTPLRNCTPPAHQGWVVFLTWVTAGMAAAFFGFIGMMEVASAFPFAGPPALRRLGVAVGFGGAGAVTCVLLWWPETRRWCGLLPADHDAEAEGR